MNILWEVSELCLEYLQQLVLWGHVVNQMLLSPIQNGSLQVLRKTFNFIIELIQLVHSEGYCYFLDYVRIAYYPSSNRDHHFPDIRNSNIDDLEAL